jgi:hypothetical protein
MAWETDASGRIAFYPVVNFTTAILAQTAIGLRVEYGHPPDESGKTRGALQLSMSAAHAVEMAKFLTEMAARATQGPPPGAAKN